MLSKTMRALIASMLIVGSSAKIERGTSVASTASVDSSVTSITGYKSAYDPSVQVRRPSVGGKSASAASSQYSYTSVDYDQASLSDVRASLNGLESVARELSKIKKLVYTESYGRDGKVKTPDRGTFVSNLNLFVDNVNIQQDRLKTLVKMSKSNTPQKPASFLGSIFGSSEPEAAKDAPVNTADVEKTIKYLQSQVSSLKAEARIALLKEYNNQVGIVYNAINGWTYKGDHQRSLMKSQVPTSLFSTISPETATARYFLRFTQEVYKIQHAELNYFGGLRLSGAFSKIKGTCDDAVNKVDRIVDSLRYMTN